MIKRSLELLSPASDAATAKQAIAHGADAVYMGGPSHGARKSASNSIEAIEETVDYAHQFHAKVYVTLNTLVYDNEIKHVEGLCRDIYHAGADALIIQDMGILRMNIPPIALHASTQCDIRTPEKALFLEKVGFSQLVLARELTLKEIRDITDVVSIPVETFVHGALCVSYSGRCQASLALTGRSGNRGECAQICRFPFNLKDAEGKTLAENKYLLSLKDFNASDSLEELIEGGVSSFKIEGRLKDPGYVKNITSLYNLKLDEIIRNNPEKYRRTSYGEVKLKFQPQADKSFNRGFTDYFLKERRPLKIASLLTPKSQGEPIRNVNDLNNGDGISFYDSHGNFTGVNINGVKDKKIIPSRRIDIPEGTQIFRTSDIKWNKLMSGEMAVRKIKTDIAISDHVVTAEDERGNIVNVPFELDYEKARKPIDYKSVFEKLGNTIYSPGTIKCNIDPAKAYRLSDMTDLRRKMVSELDRVNKENYQRANRLPEELNYPFPQTKLDYRDNVANYLAKEFYTEHGVLKIEESAETGKTLESGDVVMTTRHCILRELGLCVKEKRKPENIRFPLFLEYSGGKFLLDFDCKNCEMNVCLTCDAGSHQQRR